MLSSKTTTILAFNVPQLKDSAWPLHPTARHHPCGSVGTNECVRTHMHKSNKYMFWFSIFMFQTWKEFNLSPSTLCIYNHPSHTTWETAVTSKKSWAVQKRDPKIKREEWKVLTTMTNAREKEIGWRCRGIDRHLSFNRTNKNSSVAIMKLAGGVGMGKFTRYNTTEDRERRGGFAWWFYERDGLTF